MESERKRNSVKMQLRKVKIKINLKALWGPFFSKKVWGPQGSIPCPLLLCVGEGGREPSTHCSHMHQVPLVTCILLRYTKVREPGNKANLFATIVAKNEETMTAHSSLLAINPGSELCV